MAEQPIVSMRFRPDDLAELRAAADAEHSTVAQYIRGTTLRAVAARKPGAKSFRTASGAPLVVWTNSPQVQAWGAA